MTLRQTAGGTAETARPSHRSCPAPRAATRPASRPRPAWPASRRDRSAGNMAIELALGMPVFLAFITFVVILGRQVIAQGAVDVAAHDAARAASLARTAATARTDAKAAAQSTLAGNHLTCQSLTVTVNTSGFAVPVGQPASVTATVTCTVSFVDVALPGTPRTRTLSATFVSPLDQYRARS